MDIVVLRPKPREDRQSTALIRSLREHYPTLSIWCNDGPMLEELENLHRVSLIRRKTHIVLTEGPPELGIPDKSTQDAALFQTMEGLGAASFHLLASRRKTTAFPLDLPNAFPCLTYSLGEVVTETDRKTVLDQIARHALRTPRAALSSNPLHLYHTIREGYGRTFQMARGIDDHKSGLAQATLQDAARVQRASKIERLKIEESFVWTAADPDPRASESNDEAEAQQSFLEATLMAAIDGPSDALEKCLADSLPYLSLLHPLAPRFFIAAAQRGWNRPETLRRYGFDVNLVDVRSGLTTLQFALSCCEPRTIAWMLKLGADTNVRHGRMRRNIFHFACELENSEPLRTLLEHLVTIDMDVNRTREALSQMHDRSGPRTQGFQSASPTRSVAEAEQELIRAETRKKTYTALLNMRDDEGITPLDLARRLGRSKHVYLLLAQGAEGDTLDGSDQTPSQWFQ